MQCPKGKREWDDERDRMAEQLMRAEIGYKPNPFYPTRAPKLSDLWPCDREKYRLMADVALSTANAGNNLREPGMGERQVD